MQFENIRKIVEQGGKEMREKYKEANSVIEISLFRHGEKEKDDTKSDLDIELTSTGGKKATEKSKTKKMKQAVAYGSPRKRAQQTAGFVMAGALDAITGSESLDELRDKLDKELKVGSKIGREKRLDFDLDFHSNYGQRLIEEFGKGELLKFIVEQSDQLADDSEDNVSFTYSRGAKNIAEILEKYIKIAPRWDKLVSENPEKYTKILERFLGTHQCVLEAFLAKLLEVTKGEKERDEFIEALGDGFDFLEGFKIAIITKDKNPEIWLQYKKEKDGKVIFEIDEQLTPELLKKIKK